MKMNIIFVMIGLSILLSTGISYCAPPTDAFKAFFAVSTRELEELKKDALTKIFEYDYETCYKKTLALVEKIPNTQIYVKKKDAIAVYCVSLNNTPVGVFFEGVDASHTKVLISSASSSAKDWVASNVFSEKVQKPVARLKIKNSKPSSRKAHL